MVEVEVVLDELHVLIDTHVVHLYVLLPHRLDVPKLADPLREHASSPGFRSKGARDALSARASTLAHRKRLAKSFQTMCERPPGSVGVPSNACATARS